jgi:lipoprotein signal peptidase
MKKMTTEKKDDLTAADDCYWFAAKRNGYGWGLPTAWQGWVIYAIVIGIVVGGYFYFELPADEISYALASLGAVAFLLAACFLKGEPLKKDSR